MIRLHFIPQWILACSSLCPAAQTPPSLTVTIHFDDARATLLALEDPSLTHAQAMKVATMYGNQAALRKLHEFNINSTTQDFAIAEISVPIASSGKSSGDSK